MKSKQKPSPKKQRVIFGRDLSKDGIEKGIKKLCKEAGIEFVPSPRRRGK